MLLNLVGPDTYLPTFGDAKVLKAGVPGSMLEVAKHRRSDPHHFFVYFII